MSRTTTAFLLSIVLSASGASVLLGQSVIPSGTPVSIRTIDAIDSKNADLGKNYAASLAEPLVVNGVTMAPLNTDARLRVTQAKNSGAVRGRASLTLHLDQIFVNGQWVIVDTGDTVTTSKSQGAKTAKRSAIGAGLGAIIGGIAGGGAGAAIGAGAGGAVGAGTAMANAERIKVAPEARLTFTLTQPAQIPGGAPDAALTQSTGGWNITLDRCENSGQALTCFLTIANTAKDRDLELLSASITDSTGNKQEVRNTQLGSDRGRGADHFAKTTVSAEASGKATLEFGFVDTAVDRIGRLTIALRSNGEEVDAEFRGVPLSRGGGPR
jgi:hypothetical protein